MEEKMIYVTEVVNTSDEFVDEVEKAKAKYTVVDTILVSMMDSIYRLNGFINDGLPLPGNKNDKGFEEARCMTMLLNNVPVATCNTPNEDRYYGFVVDPALCVVNYAHWLDANSDAIVRTINKEKKLKNGEKINKPYGDY